MKKALCAGTFEKEFQMAVANRQIGAIETVFLMAAENHARISSSLIRELGSYGVRLHAFIPEEIEKLVFEKLSTRDLIGIKNE